MKSQTLNALVLVLVLLLAGLPNQALAQTDCRLALDADATKPLQDRDFVKFIESSLK